MPNDSIPTFDPTTLQHAARTQRRWLRPASYAALLLTATGALAQASDAQQDAAKAPGWSPAASIKSIANSIGSVLVPRREAPEASGLEGDANGASAESSGTQPGSRDNIGAFSIIDIERWSRNSAQVVDPECKALVQPFDIADNGASLAQLALRLKVNQSLDKWLKSAPQTSKTKDAIKLAARQLNWLPMAVEVELGESMVPRGEIVDEQKNSDTRRTYAQARAILQAIVQDLPPSLPYQFKVLVHQASYGNAVSLPGGILLLNRDLLKKDADFDYAYFALAHEIAHVLQRHQTRGYQARLIDGLQTVEDLAAFMRRAAKPTPVAIVEYATALKKTLAEFSEQQELQADSCAVRLMAKRYPDASTMELKLRALEQRLPVSGPAQREGPRSKDLVDQLKYLGDGLLERHPSGAQRAANLHVAYRALRGEK